MSWSTAASSVWGKTDPATQSWLPLVTHLQHAAAVAGLLWDHYLPQSTKTALLTELGLTDAQGRALACFFAGVHDLGKVSPVFTYQAAVTMPAVLGHMRDAGLVVEATRERIRHEAISQYALAAWLMTKHGATKRRVDTWACVVGGHHGRNPTAKDLQFVKDHPDEVGRGLWGEVRTEVLDTVALHTGVEDHLTDWVRRPLPVRAQTLLTGLVVMADWFASNQDYFPFLDVHRPSERAAIAFDELHLPRPWTPDVPAPDADALLHQRFPTLVDAHARPIQSALLEASLTAGAAPLLIVEAPMGVGKTEAALLAAEALAARFGQGGVYFGLPTMATANPMFARTLDWLGTALGPEDASVSLAHGKAGLNDRYSGLSWKGQVYDEDADGHSGQPVVNSWLRGRRKAGLAAFVVGTIDQALFSGLKAKHVALRHLGLSGKVVVIDEVHAADVYMRQYLVRVLEWLGAYETPVILMSATLPPAQRDEYVAAYAWGRGDREPGGTDRLDTYPRITRYDGTLADVPVATTPGTQTVALRRIDDDPQTVLDLLRELLVDGGCAGVICNTVARAQDLFRLLRIEFGPDAILQHSRFLAPDRAERERKLVGQLGRDGSSRPHRLVVVGTQVLEQSLDVDFDVMVTDLAPADLVLQRMGRLHRHPRTGRPDALTEPTLYLRGVDDWAASPPEAVRGSNAIYGKATLLRAAAVLAGRDGLTLPADIPLLVRQAYDPNLTPPDGWAKAWASAETTQDRADAEAGTRAQSYLLGGPHHKEDLTGWIDVASADPERSEEQGRSQVRDSEDSLEVIALWRDAGDQLRLPACAPRYSGAIIPEGHEWGTGSDQDKARAMASCTLSLPITLTNPRVIGDVINALEKSVDYSGWQKSPWIAGQLVVAFDADDRATIAGYTLHYRPDEGLVVTHPEEKP